MNRRGYDSVVVGTGPAGWAIAGAMAGHGLRVALVGPVGPWRPTYGCWTDELERLGLADAARTTLTPVTVVGHRSHRVDRRYSVVDNEVLARRLSADASTAGVELVAEPVLRRQLDGEDHELLTVAGTTLRAASVIDATGYPPLLVGRPPRRRAVPMQTAYGIVARFDRPPAPPGSCTLMDWRPAPGVTSGPPTFLYVLDVGAGRFLVEETALAAAPAVATGELRRRLAARLTALGVEPLEQIAEEHVEIPMGLAVPSPQPVLGFGAAGGLGHPATGYSLIASLRSAGELATAVAAGRAAGETGRALAERGWQALWPSDRRRARALQEYGLGVLAGLDAAAVADFFDAFFELPERTWAAYLDPVPELGPIVHVMRRLFVAAPWSLRGKLMTGDVRRLIAGSGLRSA